MIVNDSAKDQRTMMSTTANHCIDLDYKQHFSIVSSKWPKDKKNVNETRCIQRQINQVTTRIG